jgi:hypothetical protein
MEETPAQPSLNKDERFYILHCKEGLAKAREAYNNRPDVIAKREKRERIRVQKEAERIQKQEEEKQRQEKLAVALATKRKINTIQYCIDNYVPCFTFAMDQSKCCSVRWSEIDAENFTQHLRHDHNGFAIITGGRYIVIDYDEKHSPPKHIYDALMAAA